MRLLSRLHGLAPVLFLAASASTLPALAGCGGDAEPELAPVEESAGELRTASRWVGNYVDGQGLYTSLSLKQVRQNGQSVNRFEAEQKVMCVRAPCPTVKVKGKWFAREPNLTLYPEGRERETFKVSLEDDKLTLKNARGLEVAALTKATPAPSSVTETLRRHRVGDMRADIAQSEIDAQASARGVTVKFDDAFDKAVDLFLHDDEGLKGVARALESDVRADGQCSGQRDIVLCLANREDTTVSLLARNDESAPQGETARDSWVLVFFVGSFTDHGYYAVIDKKNLSNASIYSFN